MTETQRNALILRGQTMGAQLYPATVRFSAGPPAVQCAAMKGAFIAELGLMTGGPVPEATVAFSIDRTLLPVGVTIVPRMIVTWVEANRRLRVTRVGGEGTPVVYLACEDAKQG